MMASALFSRASDSKNSSFLTLLPVNVAPVLSSLLMKSSTFGFASLKVSKYHGSISVIPDTNFFRVKKFDHFSKFFEISNKYLFVESENESEGSVRGHFKSIMIGIRPLIENVEII